MKQHIFTSTLLSILFMVTACSSSAKQTIAENMCKEPRPEVCTADYVPVCGIHKDGTSKTYSNGCSACSHKEVVGYNADVCHYDESKTH
jgi:hypothetical protein